jgi:hypothetical protein
MLGTVALAGTPAQTTKLSDVEARRRAKILDAGKVRDFPACAWEKRIIRETPHYHIEANVPEMTVNYVHLLCEKLYQFYGQRLKNYPKEKLTIYIFATRDDFERTAARDGFPIGPHVGGFYINSSSAKRCAIYLPWVMQGGGNVEPSSVLMHEGFHQFFHRTFLRGDPVWLNEGMAVYFENCKFDGENLADAYISPSRTEPLQQALQAGEHGSIEQLMNIPHCAFHAGYYGQAWAFIYWLAWGQKDPAQRESNQLRFARFLADLKKPGPVGVGTFEKATGLKLKELESEWKQWVLSLDPKDDFGGKGDPRVAKPMTKANAL